MASILFVNVYAVDTSQSLAAKEQSGLFFFDVSYGPSTVSDGGTGLNFSGNDVSAVGLNITDPVTHVTSTYYGWISRPIKDGGKVKGFYFWSDASFTTLAAAQLNGNADPDDATNNFGFILVVDAAGQAYFDSLIATGGVKYTSSSSDRVDNALNGFVVVPAPPTAVADTGNAYEAGGVNNATTQSASNSGVLGNDTGSGLSVSAAGTTTAGTAVTGSTVINGTYGQLTIQTDGTYSYAIYATAQTSTTLESLHPSVTTTVAGWHNLAETTLTDTFTYEVKNVYNQTATNKLVITIHGANDAPTAVNDYGFAKVSLKTDGTAYNTADTIGALAQGNVLANDTDKDIGDNKAVTGLAASVTVNGVSTPNGTFKFSIPGGAASTFNPVGVGDEAFVIVSGVGYLLYGDAAGTVRIQAAAYQTGATKGWDTAGSTMTLNAQPLYYWNGTTIASVTSLAGGGLDGKDVGFTNNDTGQTNSIGGNLKSGTLATSGAVVSTVTSYTVGVSSASGLAAGMTVVISGTTATIQSIAYDTAGNISSITVNNNITSANGTTLTATGSAGTAAYTGHFGTLTLASDGTYVYTPFTSTSGGTAGVDTFTYTMQDSFSTSTSSATLTINVAASNSADPNAKDDVIAISEPNGTQPITSAAGNVVAGTVTAATASTATTVTMVTAGVDTFGGSTFKQLVSGRGAGETAAHTLAATNSTTTLVGAYGNLTLKGDGTYTYALTENSAINAMGASDSVSDVFYYTMQNNAAGTRTDTATLTVRIDGKNDAPTVAGETNYAVEKGGYNNGTVGLAATGNVLSNDSDIENQSISVTTAGTLTGTYGTLVLATDGTYTYTLSAAAETMSAVNALSAGQTNGLSDAFTYTVSDSGGATSTATLTIQIQGAADTVVVSDVNVNEASPWAVFEVKGLQGLSVGLALGNTTGLNTDTLHGGFDVAATIDSAAPTPDVSTTASQIQYFNGTTWVNYNAGSPPSIPAGGTLLVRVGIVNDSKDEGNEAFTLDVTTNGVVSRGFGTINDEGSGDYWLTGNNTTTPDTATLDDDRPLISITGTSGAEGTAPYVTVSIDKAPTSKIDFVPVLTSGTATVGTDTASAGSLQYLIGGDPTSTAATWTTLGSGHLSFASGVSSPIYLRLSLTDDSIDENNESFTISTGYLDGSVRNATVNGTNAVSATVTITDNDTAGFTLGTISGNTAEAGNGTATFTVKLTSQPTSDVVITVASDDSTEGTVTTGATLTFTSANWNTTQNVVVTGVDDNLDDGNVTYHVNLSAASSDSFYSGMTSSTTVVNTDDDGPPSLAINDVTVSESAGTAVFTVTRTGASDDVVTVDYTTVDASATAGSDYTAKTGSITFNAGETTKSVTISISEDNLVEGSETFKVHLQNINDTLSGGEAIGDADGVGTITDNDSPGFTVSAVSGGTTEAGGTATFTVKLTSQPTSNVVVNVVSGDTTEGAVTTGSSLTFTTANWNTTQTVVVTGQDDQLDDGDIPYLVNITTSTTDATYATLSTTVSLTTIDNDGPPVLSVNNITVGEGAGTATFTVTRTGATGDATTVDYTTGNGSATAGSDYTAKSGTLTFAAGETTKAVTVAITDDNSVESSETFTVTLSNVLDGTSGAATTGTATGTATITDDDTAGFTVGAVSGGPTEAGGTATFTVKLTSQPASNVVVTVASDDATEGVVTTGASLTFTAANWNTTQTVVVTGQDDQLDDGDIPFHINLTAASGDGNYATVSSTVSLTNTDNDGPPVLSVDDVTVSESAGTATFTVTRSGASDDVVTVSYTTQDGSATAGSDYTAASGTLTFAAGEMTKAVVVAIDNDSIDENNETVTLHLSGIDDTLSGGESIGTNDGTLTITDNDTAGFTIGTVGNTTEAGGTTTFTVKLSSEPLVDVVITVASDDSSEGTVTSGATLTFTSANWNTAQNVVVTGQDDTLDDGDIAYHVTLTAAASSDANYSGRTGSVTITNADNDGPPTVSINDVTVNEAAGTATFTVTRTGATGDVTTVDYATADVDAVAGSDYTAKSGTLTFAAGDVTKSIVVNIANDSLDEDDETFTVTLSNVHDGTSGAATTGTATGTATITDNDTAGLSIGAISGNTTEAGGTATFTLALTSQPTADVVVTLDTSDHTEGLVTSATTITFTSANWNTPVTVVVTGQDDTIDDGDIGYNVSISTASTDTDYVINTTVSVTNLDNDGPPVVSIGDVTVNEGDGFATFTVTRSGALGGETTVHFATQDDSATAGAAADYTAQSGDLTFTAGQSSKTIVVAIRDDSDAEGTEAFKVNLSAVDDTTSGAESIGTATGTGTIIDNDSAVAPGYVISAVSGDTTEGGGTATFTVKLTKAPTADVIVTVGTDDASEGTVFSGASLTFTAANWNTAQQVVIKGVDDDLDDGDIAYHATLNASSTDAGFGTLAQADVDITNTDDDSPPLISINDIVVGEADGFATFTVTRSGATGDVTTVDYTTQDNGATGLDYASDAGTITFGVGETSKEIVLAINDDNLDENAEAFDVVLSNVHDGTSPAASINPSTGTAVIVDNDTAGFTITAISGNTKEAAGGTATFTVALTTEPTDDVVITVSSDDSTEGVVTTGTSLTFTSANWFTAQTIVVTGQDDPLDDGDILYHVTLEAASDDGNYDTKQASVNVTNEDDDGPPVLTIGDVTVGEGDGHATFIVTRSGASGDTVTVNYTTADGSAKTGDSDYTLATGSLTFNAGEMTKAVVVAINDDSAVEADESFTVTLSGISDTLSGGESIGTATGTATITDNDSSGFTLTAIGGHTTEVGGTATFTVQLKSQPTDDVIVTVVSDDSTEGTVTTGGSLTFTSANWNVAQQVVVTGQDDQLDDGNVTYHVTLDAASDDDDYDAAHASVTVVNDDNDGPPVLAVNDVTVDEGDGTATFIVTRTGASGDEVTVDYATANGSATAGSDYTLATGSLTFAAGEMTKEVVVSITDDNNDENDETFTLHLSNINDTISGADSIGDADGAATITDNDGSGFTITAISGNTTEAGGTATFTVKLTTQPTDDVIITVGSDDSSEGTVTTGASLTFTSANWSTAQDVVVKGVDDTLDDGDIAYHVTLEAASDDANYDAKQASVDVTNIDNDGPPSLSIGDVTVNENAGTATFVVTRSGASGDTVTVDYTTQDGTAKVADGDYTLASGSLTFNAGETTKAVVVSIADDDYDESDETFTVHLSNVADTLSGGESIGDADGTGTITDNDTAGFTIGTVGNTTEAGGATTFTVKLSSRPTADIVITVATDDSTEGAVTAGATLTFTTANWDTTQDVVVTGQDDPLDDGDIGYHVVLTAAASSDANYSGRTTSVSVTNADNDGPPVLAINDVTVDETDGTATFVVTRTGASGDEVTVDWATGDGSAAAGSDYTGATGSLTFAAGQMTKEVVVSITDDAIDENDETFTVTLSNIVDTLSGGESIFSATGTATVTDNDTAGINIAPVAGNTTEGGGKATFSVSLNSRPTGDVVVTVASDDTTEGTVAVTTLTFTSANWATGQEVVVTGADDHLDDGDITYHVNLAATSGDGKYNAVTASADITNADDDGPPILTINDITVNEDVGLATFTVTRTGASDDVVTVDVTTQNGSATGGGADYTGGSGTLTFLAGETTGTVIISITDDDIDENDETFTVKLSNIADTLSDNESIGRATGTATITDNDTAGFSISAISGDTTEAGGTATFSVKLTSQPTGTVVITVGSDDSTEGSVTTGASLTFTTANWNTAQNVVVTGQDDHLDDGDVDYHVTVTAASSDGNYNNKTATVDVTNADDDGPPVITVADVTVAENAGTATFIVTRSGASDDVVTVDYATADDSAEAGSDYTAASGSLTFNAGETTKAVVVGITNDAIDENSEAFTLHLSNVNDTLSSAESIGDADGTGTITDNDTAGFTIGTISGNTTEAGGTATFTIKLTSEPAADVVITFASDDSTEGVVTTGASLTFTSANWNTAQDVVITGQDDHLDDGDIAYHVTVSAASGDANYNNKSASVSVTNADDDGPPVIAVNDVTIAETGGTATFVVSRSGASDDVVTVDYATANGSATAGSDYTAASGSLTFNAGETTKAVVVSITNDAIDESDETFTLHLSNVNDTLSGGESIGDADGTATITDNDTAGFTISAVSGNTTEAGGTATFTIKLTSEPTADVVITFASDDSTEGAVTTGASLTFTSANWNTAQDVVITGQDDHLDDGDIAYHVTATAASTDTNYDNKTASVNVTNADDDGPPVISIGNVTVAESDGTATFVVTRTGASDDVVTVDYATANGSATSGSDYTAASGSLTFNAGETTKEVVVSITDDDLDENNETFTVQLSHVVDTLSGGESIGQANGTATITDNDTAGFSISAISGDTDEAGGTATFTIQLTSEPTGTVVITVGSDDASEGAVTAGASLTFTSANWDTPQDVVVTGQDDELDDGDIAYHVTVAAASSDTNYNNKAASVAVTNIDDDGPPVLTVSDVTVSESAGTATFVVTRTGASDDVVTVDYATSDVSATAGADYTAASGSLTFNAGEMTKAVVVSIANDAIDENSETFTLHLSNVNDTLSGAESIGDADGTGTITDNDTAGFTVGAISGNTTEGGGTATFSFRLTSEPTGDVVVTFTSDDTGEGTVTTGSSLTFTSANWNTTQNVVVTGVNDDIDDDDIGYHVNVSATSTDANYDTRTAVVSVTNADDDTPPVVSINNITVSEGAGTATFTVTRSGATGGETTVDWTTADGSGVDTEDYVAANGTVTFAVGETSKTIVVSISDDASVESDETLKVILSNPVDATSANESIGTGTGTATINDNDSAGFVLSPVSGNTSEAGGTATFSLKLTSQPASDVVVTIASNDTTEGSVSASLTFTSANWNSNQTFVVTGVDDSLDDGDIGYTVSVSAASSDGNYNGKTTTASLTNADNDGPPVISVGNVTVDEADGTVTFTVTRTGASGDVVTVDYATADGTATDGADYTGVTGSLTFAAGETSKEVVVSILDDSLDEADETFTLQLSNAVDTLSGGESIGQANGTATITDDDSAGFDVTAISGNTTEAGGTATFSIRLTSEPTGDVVITVASSDGSEGVVTSGASLTFTAANWNTAQDVVVTGQDDHLDDGDIAYHLNVSAASTDTDYDARSAQVAVTNTDDDGPPVLTISDVTVSESAGTATFVVTRTGASDDVVTVDYATANGSATAGGDYTSASGSLTFNAGQMTKAVVVNIANDDVDENDETFTVHLSNVNDTLSGAESIGDADGTGTITDNDTAGFTIGAISGNTTEGGGTATFSFQLASEPTGDVVITFTSDDTTEGTVTTGGSLTFTSANWDTPQEVVVTGANDDIDDGDIGYHVNVSATSTDPNYDARTAVVDVTNADDDTPPVISIGNVTVSEGDGTATFTVTRSGATGGETTVEWDTADSSADAGQDYTGASGTVTFAVGETTKTVVVSITDDHLVESDETFTVELSNVADATSAGESIGTATGTATINDNDSAGFVLGPVSGNTTEAGGTATFTVKLTSQPTGDVLVTVTSADTTEGAVNTTLTFDSTNWNTAQVVTVTGVDDHLDDGDVGYTVNVAATSTDTDYDGKSTSTSLTNTDDDTPPVISIGNVTVDEADGTATFTVTRTGADGGTTTVDWATSDGSATAGLDYTAGSGTLTFAAGETSKTIVISINDDHLVESDESFNVQLSNVNDATSPAESIGQANGTATITDNDVAGFTIGAISGDTSEGGNTATFTIKLTSEPTGDVVITVASDDSTEGVVTTGATLTFNASNWDTAQDVVVTGQDDQLDDGDITYHLNVSAASSDADYDLRTGQVTVANTDDDGPPVISIGDISVAESAGNATFTVTRTGASGDAVTVDYASADGTAGSGDYTGVTGTLTFAAGETSKTVVVAIDDDHLDENDETFTVTLSNVNDTISGAESIGTATGTATVTDDDTAGFTIGALSGNTTEAGGTASFTIVLTSEPTADVVFTFTSTDTTEGTVTSTLTFTAANWNVAQAVTITGVDDPVDDGDIPYGVDISVASADANYDGRTGSVSVTNIDNDGPPVVSVAGVSVNEADGTVTFTVTRSGANGGETTVDYATADGTATAGVDYAAGSGTLTFAAGETSKTVVLSITDDNVFEANETFTLTLSNVLDASSPGESIGTGTGTATIVDNDPITLTVTGSEDVSEGTNAIFTVSLSNPSATATEIALTAGAPLDSASPGDYSATLAAYYFDAGGTKVALPVVGGKIQLPAGETLFYVSIATTQDTVYEGTELFTLGAAITGGDSDNGRSTIVDNGSGVTYDEKGQPGGGTPDDDRPTLTVTGTKDVSEGSRAIFTVTLSTVSDQQVRVDLALGANGDTASLGDWGPGFTAYFFDDLGVSHSLAANNGGAVLLPIGVTKFYVSVNTTDDGVFEGRETFTLSASSALAGSDSDTAGIVDDGTGTFYDEKGDESGEGTPDDDHARIIVTGEDDVSEGSNAVFSVRLTSPSDLPTTINLHLGSGGDTTESGDYSSLMVAYWFDDSGVKHALPITGGNVTLPAGVTQFYVSVATTADDVFEISESFTLGASVAGGDSDSGTAAILDDGTGVVHDDKGGDTQDPVDDDAPAIEVTGLPDVSEGSNAVYTVVLSNPADVALDIDLGLGGSNDTANSGDYGSNVTAYYIDGQGLRHDLPITDDGHIQLPPGVTEFFVGVPTTTDSPRVLEGAETLTLNVGIVGGASGSGTSTVVDNGSGHVYDDEGNVTPAVPDDDRPLGADLDPESDDGESNSDHVTSVITPEFTIEAPAILEAGQTVQLITPQGEVAGSSVVTAADVATGHVNVTSWQLDDGEYEFTARVLDDAGAIVGEGPVHVTVITDRDGVQPSVELAANNGDFNHDGIADWQQNNVAQLPITSASDYLAGVNAADSTFGAIIAGDLHQQQPGAAVALDPNAQLLNLSISTPPAVLPASLLQASAVFNFSVTSQDGDVLTDMDPARAGLQTRVVIELPQGVNATGYVKFNSATQTWFSYMDDGNLDTYDDGATLLDLNGDGKIDRVVVTLTDGGLGDDDHTVNGTIVDPGMLVLAAAPAPAPAPAATPVYDVKLANGDHYYTTSAGEAGVKAQGAGNVFVGAAFDSLAAADGGRVLHANYNPFTMDWYFAATGDTMPYACYEAMAGAGFSAANEGQGPGTDFHLYMNGAGMTQLMTAAQAASLNVKSQGFWDCGAVFNTTATGAFAFDAEGYLVANANNQAVKDLVHALSLQYAHTSDAGFVEAVEQDFLARVQLTGLSHGGAASAADVNAAFGTAFGG